VINALTGTLFFIIGACIGSFLNVCIARWPHELSVVRPSSRCPNCGHQLSWYENIPLVSWMVLRAKCRSCGNPISAQYPLVELLVGAGWLLAAATFGPGFTAVRVAVFGTIMLGIAVTDARHYLIPDGFTVFGLLWVLGTAFASTVTGESTLFAGSFDALVGACAGAGAIRIIGWLGEVILRKEAMGQGDETLMAVVGAALGPGRTLLTIFLGALVGAIAFGLVVYPIVRMRRAKLTEQIELGLERAMPRPIPLVPFGVFLAPAAVIALVWGQSLISWYVGQMLAAS
jgi:leader peptidase (prepilin peptidase) / N-methyltransferase